MSPSHVKSDFSRFELGGALMWEKAIYLLLDRLTPKELPLLLLKTYKSKTFDVKKLENLIPSIKASVEPLSRHDRDLWPDVPSPCELIRNSSPWNPPRWMHCTERFNARSDAQISSERSVPRDRSIKEARGTSHLTWPGRRRRKASAK